MQRHLKFYTLPDFIIIGAMRSGSTFLYRKLIEHPNVIRALKKEVHYFDSNYNRGIDWYRSHFPMPFFKRFLKKRGKHIVTGEASPRYICHPQVPKRIKETIPEVKLIALLRNPVDRAFSDYNFSVRREWEHRPFEVAIEEDIKWLNSKKWEDLEHEEPQIWRRVLYSYVGRGIYIGQLQRWLNFFPKNQLLIIKSEDMFENPPEVYKKIIHFLDLPAWIPTSFIHQARSTSLHMDAKIRKRLLDYFRPFNQRLYELVGVDFGWNE